MVTEYINHIRQLLGVVPEGYEIIEYIVAAVILVFIFSCAYGLLGGVINSILGRK
jgi:divalent metal cation (Fe/Co/Zn/Cd) transporter